MPKISDKKESSPDSTTSSSSSAGSSERSGGSSGEAVLHLQVPMANSTDSASSSQSSPRSRSVDIRRRGESGSSSSSSISMGRISYRDVADIQEEFKIVKILHDGKFSKILLAKQDTSSGGADRDGENKNNNTKSGNNNKYLVLKAIPSGGLFTEDFKREMGYNYFLSPHPGIITSFNVSFNWASSFNVFVQEHAPYGDLSRVLANKKFLPESQVKLIASQVASALDFMHSFKFVHQDLRPENVLIFKPNFSRVKLCDFGSTRREKTLITKGSLISSTSSSLLPPELCYLLPQERYECHRSTDVWQIGILLCVCLTGSCPWENADFSDPAFRQYTNWLKRKNLKVPEPFRKFSPRLVRLLKRLLEPKCHFRSEIREVFKYLSDDWIKPSFSRNIAGNCFANANNTNGSFKQKKASLKKRDVCRTTTKNTSSNKLIVLTSSGINLISGRLDEHKKADKTGGESSTGKNDIQIAVVKDEDSDEVEDESIVVKRVEHWVAAAAAAETCVAE